jgi:hypothetical protein
MMSPAATFEVSMGLSSEDLTRAISLLAGTAKAIEAAVSALIATHPEPEALQLLWQNLKPGLIDQEHEQVMFQDGLYMQSFLTCLARVSGEIDAAAQRGN